MLRICCFGTHPTLVEAVSLLEQQGFDVDVRDPDRELVRLDTLKVEADLYVLASASQLSRSLCTALEHLGANVLRPACAPGDKHAAGAAARLATQIAGAARTSF